MDKMDDLSILKRVLVAQNILTEEEIKNLIDSEKIMTKLTNEKMSVYDRIYFQDHQLDNDVTQGWIQWKGTDVCMDVHCKCGYHSHIDSDFFYVYECPKCRTKFAVGQNIKFIELKDEDEIENFKHTLKTCELEEDK